MRYHLGLVITETTVREKLVSPCPGYFTNIRLIIQNLSGEIRPNRFFFGAQLDVDFADFLSGAIDVLSRIGNAGNRVIVDDFFPVDVEGGTAIPWQTKHYGNKRVYVGDNEEIQVWLARESTATLRMHLTADFIPKYGSTYRSFLAEHNIDANSFNYGVILKAKCDLVEAILNVRGAVIAGTGWIAIRKFSQYELHDQDALGTISGTASFGDVYDVSQLDVDGVLNDKNLLKIIPLAFEKGTVNVSIPLGKVKENEYYSFDLIVDGTLDLDMIFELIGKVGKKYYSRNGNWISSPFIYNLNDQAGTAVII